MDDTLSLDKIGLRYAYNYGKGKKYTGGDKTSIGNNFTIEYEKLFCNLRDKNINLLELGIFRGKSLAMWSDYFKNGSIYGIDIDLNLWFDEIASLKRYGAFKNNNITVYQQDITEKSFVDLIEKLPSFDIVVDDALHKPETQFNNFILLFNKLNGSGYYIIEDIINPKEFIDIFSYIYMGVSNPSECKKYPYYSIVNKIESIEIKKNMIIIKKKPYV